MTNIYPILLAGGSGTRLWPLSRKSYPKQFSKIMEDATLYQLSAKRLESSDVLEFKEHTTITNTEFRFIVREQLQQIGIDSGPILVEPAAKNTAVAILAATVFTYANDQNAVLLVCPSDHLIPNTNDFHQTIKIALSHVDKGKIVTFGVEPTHPATGYGYLELSESTMDSHGTSSVTRFVEKPNLEDAEKMLISGNFLWNAGIFLFRAEDMIEAFKEFAPDIFELVSQSMSLSTLDLGFVRPAEEPWSKLADISIDYAIMEKAHNLITVPFRSKWSDLGGWDSVWAESEQDSTGTALFGKSIAIDSTDCLLRSESDNQQLVGIGLNNIIAIAMPDAVLVARKDRPEDIKLAVNALKKSSVPQAEIFPKDHRPWGWFESLVIGNRFQVKRIYVKPGESLSLQSHRHRSEHWIVVEGTATVTIDHKTQIITEGQSVYVPLGAVHRMENLGKLPMVLVEVQIGTYLGEDDIQRYDDQYGRN